MSQFTYFDGKKWCLRIGDTEYSNQAVDRLAAYEETGLEPEEIEKIAADVESGFFHAAARRYGIPVDRLRSWPRPTATGGVWCSHRRCKGKHGEICKRADPAREETPTYQMTREGLDKLAGNARRAGYADAIYICNALYSAAMLTVLRDTLGYGQRRLKLIFERVQKLFGEVMDGYVSYADLAQTLYDECRINLVIERPGRRTSGCDGGIPRCGKRGQIRMVTK